MISLIYETRDFIAVNKPAGVLVHPIKDSREETLVDWVLKRYPEVKNVGDDPAIRPGIVHRLDRDTSGVILIARNQEFFEYLKNLFKTHQIKKTYLALVWGKLEPKSGEINAPIGIKSGTIKRTVWQKRAKDLKEAITEYKVKKYFKDFSLVELNPKTGRTHQIRIHLASVNHPVVGDKLYGFKKTEMPFDLSRQFLHAFSLEFSAADGHRIKIEAELPEELGMIIDTLEKKR
ncbi:MAG: RluA family pseudouridine synthase [Candidatus Paceibacterota bacterium]